MNLARLNHILIPDTKEGRDRVRSGWFGKLVAPLGRTYAALSDEGRVVFALASVAGIVGLDVARSQNHLVWASLFSLLVASVAVRPWFRLERVRIEVQPPHRPMVGEETLFHVAVRNEGERDVHGLRCERPFLPWDGEWLGSKPRLASLPAGAHERLTVKGRVHARGRHHLDAFSVGALVPLGLAVGDRVASGGVRFTVVPRVAAVALQALPRAARHQPGGIALASDTAESTELIGLRPYRHGDRLRDLHARTWARVGAPVVREYHQEYFSRVGVVLDTDGTAAGEEEREAAISLAAGVLEQLERGDALIDLLVTGGRLHPMTLGRSLATLDQGLEHLACVEPGGPLDPSALLALLGPHLERLSCVVVVALRWDEAREQLVAGIRRGGVGCRVAVVTEADAPPMPVADADVRRHPVPRIARACRGGEAIAL